MPNKLLLVRNNAKATEIRAIMGKEWIVYGMGCALKGGRFDVIMIVDQPIGLGCPFTEADWIKYIEDIKTKLSPNGKLIEVY